MPEFSDEKPQHIAIVMDGNGRWAEKQNQPRVAGHRQGVASVKSAIQSCLKHEIPVLTLFAFSQENWQRPEEEVGFLMDLFLSSMQENLPELADNHVRIRFMGDRSVLSVELQRMMRQVERATEKNAKLSLNIAISYSGKWDIVQACQKIAVACKRDMLDIDEIDENVVRHHLMLPDLPDPDLFIRTSGELRISNFMLWQFAYTEFYFTDEMWPDFNEASFEKALEVYATRNRRFGRVESKTKETPCLEHA